MLWACGNSYLDLACSRVWGGLDLKEISDRGMFWKNKRAAWLKFSRSRGMCSPSGFRFQRNPEKGAVKIPVLLEDASRRSGVVQGSVQLVWISPFQAPCASLLRRMLLDCLFLK